MTLPPGSLAATPEDVRAHRLNAFSFRLSVDPIFPEIREDHLGNRVAIDQVALLNGDGFQRALCNNPWTQEQLLTLIFSDVRNAFNSHAICVWRNLPPGSMINFEAIDLTRLIPRSALATSTVGIAFTTRTRPEALTLAHINHPGDPTRRLSFETLQGNEIEIRPDCVQFYNVV